MITELNIWNRQPNESARAYEAFESYFQMGPKRSLDAVGQKLGKSTAICERWSSRYDWVNRAAAYDTHLSVIEEMEREKLVAKNAEKWHQRREAIREEGFAMYEALKKKAEQMMQFPVTKITKTDNGQTTILEPADWNFNTAARLMETAVKIGRLSVDLSTSNELDVTKLTEPQLDALIAGKPLSAVLAIKS